MTQNNGEHADIAGIAGIEQTAEAKRQTELTAQIIGQRPMIGAVIDYYSRTIGVLAWFTNTPTGDVFAHVDNGTLTTDASGKGDVTVRLQNPETGVITTHTMPDIVTAFYRLGLHTHRCNGINMWLEMDKAID